MPLLGLLSNRYIQYGAIVLVVVLLLVSTYLKGRASGIEKMTLQYEAEKIVWQQEIATQQNLFNLSTQEIATTYKHEVDSYKRALATVSEKETIVKYVGTGKCDIPNGFVEIHNKAAKGKSLEETPKINSHQPSGRSLTDTATVVSQNYLLYADCANKLRGLQSIVKSFQAAQKALPE